ncbi:hypothetical protein PINS_up023438 [Pythium insidiosum]|nr:hypothetical protein PINS_up023438 [Pythium insidiosum]
MNGVSCALSREQYEDMLFLDRAFAGRRAVGVSFPECAVPTILQRHNATVRVWDYAVRSVIIRRLHHRVNDSSKAGRTKDRRLYIEVYKMQIRKGGLLDPSTKEAKRAAEFEIAYPAEVVMAYGTSQRISKSPNRRSVNKKRRQLRLKLLQHQAEHGIAIFLVEIQAIVNSFCFDKPIQRREKLVVKLYRRMGLCIKF